MTNSPLRGGVTMKKIAIGLIIGLLLGIATPIFASQAFSLIQVNYPVYVNGAEYVDEKLPLLNYSGRTYIPLRKIANILGAKYSWNEDEYKLYIGDADVEEPWSVDQLKVSEDNDKLIVVIGKGVAEATIHVFHKLEGKWVKVMETDGHVGRNGISSSKKEGDGETPAGVYGLSRAFGVGEDPGSLTPYTQLTHNDFWVDDVDSKYYNMWAKGDVIDKDWDSAEDLYSEDIAYKYSMVINYNLDPIVKGNGSAIFLHVDMDEPTAGCVSVPEDKMIELLRFIDEDTKIVIAQTVEDLLLDY